jgi:uncharacterized membrane protein
VTEPAADQAVESSSTGVDPRLSSLLAYTAWWVSGLIFLIVEQQHRGVRFHAAQSLILFGALSLLIAVMSAASIGMLLVSAAAFQFVRTLAELLWIGAVVVWLALMLKTYKGETWRVPIVADFADRLAGSGAGPQASGTGIS